MSFGQTLFSARESTFTFRSVLVRFPFSAESWRTLNHPGLCGVSMAGVHLCSHDGAAGVQQCVAVAMFTPTGNTHKKKKKQRV